jgi:hypothetical protein
MCPGDRGLNLSSKWYSMSHFRVVFERKSHIFRNVQHPHSNRNVESYGVSLLQRFSVPSAWRTRESIPFADVQQVQSSSQKKSLSR